MSAPLLTSAGFQAGVPAKASTSAQGTSSETSSRSAEPVMMPSLCVSASKPAFQQETSIPVPRDKRDCLAARSLLELEIESRPTTRQGAAGANLWLPKSAAPPRPPARVDAAENPA